MRAHRPGRRRGPGRGPGRRAVPVRRRPTVALVALALAAGPASPGAAAQTAPPSELADLERFVRASMAEWDVPGVAVAVVKDDRVVFADGWGVRDVRDGGAVDEHTLFGIMSTTKAFTSTAVAMLVDEGRIDWEDRVAELLPGFAMPDPWVTRELTVRDLLSHRAGVERGDFLWFGSGWDRGQIVRRLRHLEEVGSFRATYGYSNDMYIAAGELIEAVAGTSWDAFVDARIFTPLGMHATNTTVDALVDAARVAEPHEEIDGEVRPVRRRSLDNEAPGGSINSTAREMAEWLRFQLGDGVHDGDTLVAAEALLETRTPQTVIPFDDGALATNPGLHFLFYAMGWTVQDYRGRALVQHSGGIDGYRSRVALVPELGLGLVVLTNKGRYNYAIDAIRNHVLDAWLGGDVDWIAPFREAERADRAAEAEALEERLASRVEGTSPSLPLEAYAGRYESDAFGEAVVTLRDGRLWAQVGPSIQGPLEHWHYDTFRAEWGNPYLGWSLVTFELDADGGVRTMDWEGWWPEYRRVRR